MSWKSKLAGLIVISILIGVAYTNQDYIKEILNHGITNNPPICPSAFTYTIYKDSILTYQKNSSGQIVDSNSDPAIVINNALWDCSEAGKGSVYVVTNTYTVKQLIGANPIYNNRYSNIYLMFGAGTIIQRSSGSGASDYMFTLHNFNGITSNFTLASNGTTTFIGNNYASGFDIFNTDHFTMINMKFEHLVGIGGGMTKCRYPYLENIEVFDPCMSYTSFLLGMEQIQYGTFKNMNLNANYRYDTCLEGMFFGMEDWIDFANGWDGSYNNAFSKLWIRNMRRNAVYLSGGDYNQGYRGVSYNTFDNCTFENNYQDGYFGIKLRPAQHNRFTNIVIRNMTGGVTTGTAYNDYTYSFGDCDGNYIQADMYNIRTQPLTLTSDGDNQGVYNNEFHLTEHGGPRTYFSSHTNTRIYHNTIYMDFEDTRGGLYFEKGFITDNVFYVSFKNSGIGGYTDISHDNANWAGVTNNVINVISTSGNPNGLSDFVSGTQGNIINHVG